MIVIRFATIMDGPVVRWYDNMATAKAGHSLISASRNGVCANGYISRELFDVAWSIHERLSADSQASTRDVVTHTKNLLGTDLRPVQAEGGV